MSNRGCGYGLSAQVANKVTVKISSDKTATFLPQLASKRDPDLESEIIAWIEAIIGEKLPSGNYEDILKDGIVLCK